ncbi:MAG: hypothetical protein IPM37_07320 [Hahellaceae bacterium]|nr:hypothetical protein [Hahellaceae bacterium]
MNELRLNVKPFSQDDQSAGSHWTIDFITPWGGGRSPPFYGQTDVPLSALGFKPDAVLARGEAYGRIVSSLPAALSDFRPRTG